MRNITKVSEITPKDVWEYINQNDSPDGDDFNTLKTLITVSKAYIKSYTGRKEEDLDNYEDFVIVVLVLCQDMWDNRTLYVDTTNVNLVVQSILDLHSVNLL